MAVPAWGCVSAHWQLYPACVEGPDVPVCHSQAGLLPCASERGWVNALLLRCESLQLTQPGHVSEVQVSL